MKNNRKDLQEGHNHTTQPINDAKRKSKQIMTDYLIVLGFNDMSTLLDHSVLSPREMKRNRRDSRGDVQEGHNHTTRSINDAKKKSKQNMTDCLIVLGFNDTLTLVGHFVSSPREMKRRDSRGDESGDRRERKTYESEEIEEIKTFPPLPLPTARIAGLAKPISI